MIRYRTIEHTADIGIHAWGKDLSELFENAAAGMFSIVCNLSEVRTENSFEIEAEAEDLETLLVEWLNELLFLSESRGVLLSSFKAVLTGETRLEGTAAGERIDPDRHWLGTEIKAVTYHMLKVEQTDDGWEATVIFDV